MEHPEKEPRKSEIIYQPEKYILKNYTPSKRPHRIRNKVTCTKFGDTDSCNPKLRQYSINNEYKLISPLPASLY